MSIKKSPLLIGLFCLVIGFISCSKAKEPADLVLTNGKIETVDDKNPEVQAIAIKGDKILAVGTDKEIKRYVTSKTRIIDLKGKLAIPGLIESHGHFTSLGYGKMRIDLMQTKSWDHIVEKVKEAAKRETFLILPFV